MADTNGGLHLTRRLAFVGGLCAGCAVKCAEVTASNMSRAHLVSSTDWRVYDIFRP